MPLVDFFCETCSKPWLVGWWDQVGELGVGDGQETRPWPSHLGSSSPWSGLVCAAVHVCGLNMKPCDCLSLCVAQGWAGRAGGWGCGSLAGCDCQHSPVCVPAEVWGCLTICLFAWVMMWPSLRSYGSVCGGVCWDTFMSLELCDFWGV